MSRIVLTLLIASVLAACGEREAPPQAQRAPQDRQPRTAPVVPTPAPPPSDPRGGAEPRAVADRGDLAADEVATIDLFERSKGAVVHITTTQRVRDPWSRNVMSIPSGTGSGFVWDGDGHVVTNNHVIAQASGAQVRLNDGREVPAALVGTSPAHDLAVLRIQVKERQPAALPIGTSANLRVGQKVFAIGNPFGLDWSLTTGVVSALNRSLPTQDETGLIQDLVQTDAAINPGNSGGPLLDSAGRLIGVNTAIFSPSGAYAGVGFAVPVDTVNRVVPQLISRGRYTRPLLGVSVDAGLNEMVERQMGVKGVAVAAVERGSPAAEAGLRGARQDRSGGIVPGDLILAVDGRAVTEPADLIARLDERKVGDVVKLRVLRDGRETEVSAKLAASRR
jgi:S1-C subfamily serine protease